MQEGWLDFEKPLVELEQRIQELRGFASRENLEFTKELEELEKKAARLRKKIFSNLTPWQRVQLARHPRRPYALDYIKRIFTDFVELHGDRGFRDDPAIVAGLARFRGRPIAVIGHQKGRSTKENLKRNFGMPHPEGYRKALRVMKLAEKFGNPIVTFVDTPGAYPGVGAEERGQAEAIARNIREMASLRVPIVVFVTGEGGSGGALAIAVGDRVYVLEYAFYSVISPEGCASILWKTREKAPTAAETLRFTAPELLRMKVVDAVVPEPEGGAHRDPDSAAASVASYIEQALEDLDPMDPERLVAARRRKYLAMGDYEEVR